MQITITFDTTEHDQVRALLEWLAARSGNHPAGTDGETVPDRQDDPALPDHVLTVIKERVTPNRQQPMTDFLARQVREHGCEPRPARTGPQVRLHLDGPGPRGAYTVVAPSRVVFRLKPEVADKYTHAQPQYGSGPYGVVVHTGRGGPEAVEQAHELAALAAREAAPPWSRSWT